MSWIDTSDTIDAVSAALVQALGAMTDVVKTQTANAGQFGYTYATLADVFSMARPVLAAHDLCVTQAAESTSDEVVIWTTILHSSGQYLSARPLRLPAGKNPQATGSAISYGKRYAVMAVLGLATEDDDAQSATQAPVARSQAPKRPKAATAAPAARSAAEAQIRRLLADLPDPRAMKEAFIEEWGVGLADLEPTLHDAALAWLEALIAG